MKNVIFFPKQKIKQPSSTKGSLPSLSDTAEKVERMLAMIEQLWEENKELRGRIKKLEHRLIKVASEIFSNAS